MGASGYCFPRRGLSRALTPRGVSSLVASPSGECSSVASPTGGAQVGELPRRGTKQCDEPRWGLSSFVGQVPVQGGARDAEVFGDVPGGVPVALHPPRRREVAGVGDFLAPPKLRPARPRGQALERCSFLH